MAAELPNETAQIKTQQHFYANGFQVGITSSDTSLVLMLDGSPMITVHLSFTSAKTLANKINGLMAQFEEKVSQKIMTIDDVNERLQK